jgi:tRNA(Ile)-lysidine synthase
MLDRVTIEQVAIAAADGPVLVALSGGGDSTALLHLLVEEFGAERLRAIVIDHALRAGSADDASRARDFAAALGVRAEVSTLAWPRGVRRAQQAVRVERYRALCEAARGMGVNVIALGHTADDQAETVLMRAASGSTWRGLAGMAPVAHAPVWPEGRGMRLARPLLNVRRAQLRDVLRRRSAPWIEDPANVNEAYERVRARARLADLERAGFDGLRLAELAARLRPFVARLDRAASALILRAAAFEGDRILIRRDAWVDGPEVRRRALGVLIAAAAGSMREPGHAEIERLEVRLSNRNFRGATLGGAVLDVLGGQFALTRDPGALTGRAGGARPVPSLALAPEVAAVWDGRLELRAMAPGLSVQAGPTGPVLAHAGRMLALSQGRDICAWRWLLEDRVRHLLE